MKSVQIKADQRRARRSPLLCPSQRRYSRIPRSPTTAVFSLHQSWRHELRFSYAGVCRRYHEQTDGMGVCPYPFASAQISDPISNSPVVDAVGPDLSQFAELPDIAAHVVEAEAIRREGADGRRALISVFFPVLPRKASLPDVCGPLAARLQLAAPRIAVAIQATARREFKLGFGRQSLVRPLRVSHRIVPRDLDCGMIFMRDYRKTARGQNFSMISSLSRYPNRHALKRNVTSRLSVSSPV